MQSGTGSLRLCGNPSNISGGNRRGEWRRLEPLVSALARKERDKRKSSTSIHENYYCSNFEFRKSKLPTFLRIPSFRLSVLLLCAMQVGFFRVVMTLEFTIIAVCHKSLHLSICECVCAVSVQELARLTNAKLFFSSPLAEKWHHFLQERQHCSPRLQAHGGVSCKKSLASSMMTQPACKLQCICRSG